MITAYRFKPKPAIELIYIAIIIIVPVNIPDTGVTI